MDKDKRWDIRHLLLHWGIVSGKITTFDGEGKRSSSADEKIERNVELERALFGAFMERKVQDSMYDSGVSKGEIESVVCEIRRMLVEWAHTLWASACANDDTPSLFPTSDSDHS